jgi:hypothetical protein
VEEAVVHTLQLQLEVLEAVEHLKPHQTLEQLEQRTRDMLVVVEIKMETPVLVVAAAALVVLVVQQLLLVVKITEHMVV